MLLSTFVAFAAACGAAPHPQKPIAEVAFALDSAPSSQPALLPPLPNRHAKLTYDLGAIAPLPFVHGTIGGVSTWMIVDSGASTQFLTGWMAARVKVETRPTTALVSDHVRHNMSVGLADRSLIAIDGWGGLTSGELLVIDDAARWIGSRFGIGVMLSPQLLDDDRAVILELDRSSIEILLQERKAKVTLTAMKRYGRNGHAISIGGFDGTERVEAIEV